MKYYSRSCLGYSVLRESANSVSLPYDVQVKITIAFNTGKEEIFALVAIFGRIVKIELTDNSVLLIVYTLVAKNAKIYIRKVL